MATQQATRTRSMTKTRTSPTLFPVQTCLLSRQGFLHLENPSTALRSQSQALWTCQPESSHSQGPFRPCQPQELLSHAPLPPSLPLDQGVGQGPSAQQAVLPPLQRLHMSPQSAKKRAKSLCMRLGGLWKESRPERHLEWGRTDHQPLSGCPLQQAFLWNLILQKWSRGNLF